MRRFWERPAEASIEEFALSWTPAKGSDSALALLLKGNQVSSARCGHEQNQSGLCGRKARCKPGDAFRRPLSVSLVNRRTALPCSRHVLAAAALPGPAAPNFWIVASKTLLDQTRATACSGSTPTRQQAVAAVSPSPRHQAPTSWKDPPSRLCLSCCGAPWLACVLQCSRPISVRSRASDYPTTAGPRPAGCRPRPACRRLRNDDAHRSGLAAPGASGERTAPSRVARSPLDARTVQARRNIPTPLVVPTMTSRESAVLQRPAG